LLDSKDVTGLGLSQATLFECAVDLNVKTSLNLLLLGVRKTEIGEFPLRASTRMEALFFMINSAVLIQE
jgi:hypothetical protein